MKYLIKPLTESMLTDMRNGRAIELSKTKRNTCNAGDFKGSLPALRRRGFVNTKKVIINNKKIQSVYLTEAGIDFLANFGANPKSTEVNTILSDSVLILIRLNLKRRTG
jgi:hypothetical protein